MRVAWRIAALTLTRRRATHVLVAFLLLISLAVLASMVREANYRATSSVIAARRAVNVALSAGRIDGYAAKAEIERIQKEEEQRIRTQYVLVFPRSMQMVSQTMVTAGAFVAVLLGAVAVGSPLTSGFLRTATIIQPTRIRVLLPHLISGMIVWTVVVAANAAAGAIAGIVTPRFLLLHTVPHGLPVMDLLLALIGVWMAGGMWVVIGGSLAAVTRSTVTAILAGTLLLVAENALGAVVLASQSWLPSYGAVNLVSEGAPRLLHGLFLLRGSFPVNPPSVPVALTLVSAVTLLAVSLAAWRFRRSDFV